MNDTSFYERVLGISAPWRVTSIDLSMERGEVVVRVVADDVLWGCPECAARMHRHGTVTRRWRHLDTCQLTTIIEAEVPRLKCPEHGTWTVQVPWAEANGRFTAMFERVALFLFKNCSVSAAARHLRISWAEADGIKARAVKRGLARRRPVPAKAVCVDEKAVGCGHDYITVVTRVPVGGKPFIDFIADGREKSALDRYWDRPETGPLAHIACASMDMWRPFMDSAAEHLAGGERAVTHDPFHVIKHMNDAVDKVRRQEQSLLGGEAGRLLKGTRSMWLWGFERLPAKWNGRMAEMKDGKTKTARAWRLKEMLRTFYDCENYAQAKAFIESWWRSAVRCRLRPVVAVARMIKSHLPQILNYFIYRVTNAFSEGLNSLIQNLISRARGYRNRERLKMDLYFHLGSLDMDPVVNGFPQ